MTYYTQLFPRQEFQLEGFSQGICLLLSCVLKAAACLTILIMSAELAWKRLIKKVHLRSSLGVVTSGMGYSSINLPLLKTKIVAFVRAMDRPSTERRKGFVGKARALWLFVVPNWGSLGFRLFFLYALNLHMHRFAQVLMPLSGKL